jgi:hypothetical protein
MQQMNNQRFEQLKAQLSIDPMRLDEELIRMPQFVQEVAELTAESLLVRNVAENDLKIAIAEASADIRGSADKKPAEAQIASEVLLENSVQEAMGKLEQAKYEYAMWQGLMDGAKTKSASLKNTSDLINSGYLTPDTIYANRRRELNEHRRAKIREKQDG